MNHLKKFRVEPGFKVKLDEFDTGFKGKVLQTSLTKDKEEKLLKFLEQSWLRSSKQDGICPILAMPQWIVFGWERVGKVAIKWNFAKSGRNRKAPFANMKEGESVMEQALKVLFAIILTGKITLGATNLRNEVFDKGAWRQCHRQRRYIILWKTIIPATIYGEG